MEAMTSVLRMSKTERLAEVGEFWRWSELFKAIGGVEDVFRPTHKGMGMVDGGWRWGCGHSSVLCASEDWSATVNAHRGKFLFGAMGGHGPGHLEDGGDGEGTAAAVQKHETEQCSVS
ncbi:hypothetical protein PPACK8108_LOCUS10116 [Phakopsora pachyrhizi]|uniref:Uncharacterized protein n=1 Tax=Phakopsora pachyrhizi TaxID=170000 RepID=A0AAV0AXQ9_PHAPC|nr:hypothetical protein PPACK8108_LOCUS10116 [Phakopsora pachyrhizi]